jgi:hypothetical protein
VPPMNPPRRDRDVDLDAFAPRERDVIIRGERYKIPGEIGLSTVTRATSARRQMYQAQMDQGQLIVELDALAKDFDSMADEEESAETDEERDAIAKRVAAAQERVAELNRRQVESEDDYNSAIKDLHEIAVQILNRKQEVDGDAIDLTQREILGVVSAAMTGAGGDFADELAQELGGAERKEPKKGGPKPAMAIPKTKKPRRAAASKKPSRERSSS